MLNAIKRRAASGTLVIAILHDLNLAALLAERIFVLAGGRLDSDGTPMRRSPAKCCGAFSISRQV
jgi:ABC-type hemin transport system ATPase subunit